MDSGVIRDFESARAAISFCASIYVSPSANLDFDRLAQYFNSSTAVKEIDVSGCEFTAGFVQRVSQIALSRLNLAGGGKICNGSSSEVFVVQFPNTLLSLNMSDCDSFVTSQLLECMGQLVSLRELNLSGCSNVTDLFLISLSLSLINLDTLNLSRCSNLVGTGLAPLSNRNVGIRSLDLSGLQKLADSQCAACLLPLKRLESFSARNCSLLGVQTMNALKVATCLKSLDISRNSNFSSTEVLDFLQFSKKIEKLDISGCSNLHADLLVFPTTVRFLNISLVPGISSERLSQLRCQIPVVISSGLTLQSSKAIDWHPPNFLGNPPPPPPLEKKGSGKSKKQNGKKKSKKKLKK